MAKQIMVMFKMPETGARSLPAAYEEVLMMIAEGCTKRGWPTPSIGVVRVEQGDVEAQMAWSVEVADVNRGTVTLVFDAGGLHELTAVPGGFVAGGPRSVIYIADENGSVLQSRRLPTVSMASLVRTLQQWPLDLMDRMAQEEFDRRQGGGR